MTEKRSEAFHSTPSLSDAVLGLPPLSSPSSRLNLDPSNDSLGMSEEGSPFQAPHRYHSEYDYGPASSTLRHVQRVSKRAALASKKVIWDSNDNAIDAAQSAVDQWEEAYNALRGLLVASTQSAKSLYGAAKAGATGLEHGILLPVRDWILLPAFDAAEKTAGFIQSEQAHHVASQSLQLAHQVPWIGPTVLAPAMVLSVQVFQTTWHIAKYPIPSRHQVRNSVDFVLTGTKWTLSTAGREVFLYMKRADAIITRTLSHTRWKVLNSGPYAGLDKLNKQEVIDHLCERYFSLKATIARYELAAHIRAHNLPLYLDLVLTGLLRERGRELTKDDEWLSSCPSYRKHARGPFLLPNYDFEGDGETSESDLSEKESALWFRLPNVNGKRPGRDAPWVRFNGEDRAILELRYLKAFEEGKRMNKEDNSAKVSPLRSTSDAAIQENGLERPATSSDAVEPNDESPSTPKRSEEGQLGGEGLNMASGYPTIAQWHVPDLARDVMVDQKRHSVSYYSCCPRCRSDQNSSDHLRPSPPKAPPKFGEICQECAASQAVVTNHWMASSILSPPPLSMVMRPNLWRFHGSGDEIRRAVWFLDTRRHGLQPYGEEAQAVLEDAYLFLKWRNEHLKEGSADAKEEPREPVTENSCPENGTYLDKDEDDDENALLTVQVASPDGGEHQLVQFSSSTTATAIKKGLGGAISLFKRRVYRGADLLHPTFPDSVLGVSPEAVFSGDVNLKSQQQPLRKDPASEGQHDVDVDVEDEEWAILPMTGDEASLAVPATQFDDVDRRPRNDNEAGKNNDDDIDHLVLIVHGIGEMLQSVDLFGLPIPSISSIIDCCGYLRNNHEEVQSARFSQMYPTSESTSTASTGRVEYLPIEWHEAFSITSQRLAPTSNGANPEEHQLVSAAGRSSQVMMQDITLKTIQNMRGFANNTLFDVLYFMSAEHHDVIVDIVTSELNVVAQKFKALTGFHGRVSVIGHSLGSIILYDILANQAPPKNMESFPRQSARENVRDVTNGTKKPQNDDWENVSSMDQKGSTFPGGYQSPSDQGSTGADTLSSSINKEDDVKGKKSNIRAAPAEVNSTTIENDEARSSGEEDSGTHHQSSKWQYPKLVFDVDNAFMLGSPIAVFLLVRNQRKPLSESFSLDGCSRVYNIFHPYDPVAYRIEPLLDPRNAEFEPRIMTHWNGGFRVQYQTKRLWRKLIQTTMQTQQTVIEKLEAGIAGMGLLDSTGDGFDEDNQSQPSSGANDDDRSTARVVTGQLNQGRRIDYMLQEKEIEAANEYVAALAAHSCYWQEKDLSLFIARQIYLSRLAHEQALHFEDLIAIDETS